MEVFEPELGQAAFGQPYKRIAVSQVLGDALMAIDLRLCLKMWQTNPDYDSPFANSGNTFICDAFAVQAYSWDDEAEQYWNFRWRDVEVSWYKYLGRGMSVNKVLTNRQIEAMLDDCYRAIQEYSVQTTESKP